MKFQDNTGFAIGTVKTVGLTTTGNTTLSSTGTVTQSQKVAAAGLELLGAAGVYTLNSINNVVTTLAGSTGTVKFQDNAGFAIGTVNTGRLDHDRQHDAEQHRHGDAIAEKSLRRGSNCSAQPASTR